MASLATSEQPALIATSNAAQDSVTVDPYRAYEIQHTGLNASASADTNTVILSLEYAGESAPTITATMAEGTNKLALVYGEQTIILPPGADKVHFQSMAGAPMINVIPGPDLRGGL